MSVAFGNLLTGTAAANFRRWFSDSQVTDEVGNPLVMYHGTTVPSRFTRFKMPRTELGAHFGTSPQASSFLVKDNPNSRIYEVYLRILNPLELPDMYTWHWRDVAKGLRYVGEFNDADVKDWEEMEEELMLDAKVDSEEALIQAMRVELEERGYDGIRYLNTEEGARYIEEESSNEYDYSYIVWHPEQIKSAKDNNGNFDPTDPDILHGI